MAQFLDTDTVLSPERRRTNDNIIGCFNKLFSARGVNLQEITRLNERNFISNMRECVVELQLICGQGTA